MTATVPASILVVDDVEANLIALEAMLSRDGIELILARSGPEALEVLLARDVALALVDVQMPEMNGFELAELMRGSPRTRHVPIIFLTAHLHEPAREFKGYEAGAVDFLVKPIEAHLLRSKVDVFVELHQQRRKLDEQLVQLQHMLRLSDLFLGVLGHDLRNPLGAIRMGADLLLKRGDEPTKQVATRIRNASDRMARMIQQLLDYARVRLGGGIPVLPTQTDLAELARAAVAELRDSTSTPITVDVRGDSTGAWDTDRIMQVISNLVANAVTHGTPGESVQVVVDGVDPARVNLEVKNAGGISERARRTLFQPAVDREPTEATGGGLGLGLFIVDQIARAHGGTAELMIADPAVTWFRIALPRASAPRQ